MRLLFIFCEGAHDIALLGRLLPQVPGVTASTRKLKDFPAPFPGFWKERLGHVLARAESRPAEHRGKLPPPWLEMAFEGGGTLYLLLSMNGMNQRRACSDVLLEWRRLTSLEENPFGSQSVDRWDAAFILDADDEGVQARRTELFDWLKRETLIDGHPDGNAWATSRGYSVGCFVVHGPDSDHGSIEDHWIPIAESAVGDRIQDARSFIAKHETSESKVKKRGRVGKATLTIAGQIDHPGDSLAVILRDTTWTSDRDIALSSIGAELLGFLRSIAG